MADLFDSPVSASQASSLEGAADLLGKTARILAAATVAANARWPEFKWPVGESKIKGVLGGQFGRHRRYLVVAGEEYRAYLFMGVVSVDGEAQCAVWVETRNKAIEPRRQVIHQADIAGLGPEWERDMGAWGGLHKSARLVSFASHDQVVGWFLTSLAELDEAGILAMIPGLGTVEPVESVDDEDAVPLS